MANTSYTSSLSLRKFTSRVRRVGWMLVVVLALSLASSSTLLMSAQAQSLSAAAVGASAVGVEAGSATSATVNPALLGLRRHGFQLSLTPLSAGFANNAFSVKHIETYFFDHWEEEQKKAILALIPDADGAWIAAADGTVGARLALGPISVGGSFVLAADVKLDKDIFDLVLNGNELNRTYSIARSGGNVIAYGEAGGSLSVPITPLARLLHVKEFHFGAAYKGVYGVGFLEAEAEGDGFTFIFDETEANFSGDGRLTILHAQHGEGRAFDIGVAVAVSDALHVDVALNNVGEITWRNVEKSEFEAEIDIESGVAEFVEVFSGELDEPYVAPTPQSLRVGVGGALGTRIRWAADYTRQLKGPGAGKSSFGAGVELAPIRLLPLRLGVKSAIAGGLTYTAGVGLHLGPLTVDIGTPDLRAFFMQGTEWSVAASTGIRF